MTIIGVKKYNDDDGYPNICVHPDGALGAGIFDPLPKELPRLNQFVVVKETDRRVEGQKVEKITAQNFYISDLKRSFGYPVEGNYEAATIYNKFDIRDEICSLSRGFRHGDILKIAKEKKKEWPWW